MFKYCGFYLYIHTFMCEYSYMQLRTPGKIVTAQAETDRDP